MGHIPTNSNIYMTYSNKYKANCSKKVTKSIYTQSVTTQKCGTFIEYIIKRHIVANNDTKVWHIRDLYCPITGLQMCQKNWHKQTRCPKCQNLAHNVAIHKMVNILKKLKNLTTPIFLVGLIYRWGKGPKFKNICINVSFSRRICEKLKKNFFTFLTFWGDNVTFRG